MKQFENKVLFIKDEETLFEIAEIVEEKGFSIDYSNFHFSELIDINYFQYFEIHQDFFLGFKYEEDQEITLEQFKELLKQ